MANGILSAAAKVVTHTPQYRLPEADRQAILAQSQSAKRGNTIERQRNAFLAANNGCEFGYFDSNKTTN